VISRAARTRVGVRTRASVRLLTAVALTVAAGGATIASAYAGRPNQAAAANVTVDAAPGSATALPGYLIQSSSKVSDDSAVSKPGFSTTGWFPVPARSTVLAGLLANNKYPDPFFSTNLKSINAADFTVPWWYRADITLGNETGLHTFLSANGVISAADVWVNGNPGGEP